MFILQFESNDMVIKILFCTKKKLKIKITLTSYEVIINFDSPHLIKYSKSD